MTGHTRDFITNVIFGQRFFITIVILFAERLKALMEAHDIKQVPLSKASGISQGALSNYLAGRLPKVDELCRLADYFKVSTDSLLGRAPLNLPPTVPEATNQMRTWVVVEKIKAAQVEPTQGSYRTSKKRLTKELFSRPIKTEHDNPPGEIAGNLKTFSKP